MKKFRIMNRIGAMIPTIERSMEPVPRFAVHRPIIPQMIAGTPVRGPKNKLKNPKVEAAVETPLGFSTMVWITGAAVLPA